MATKPMLEGWKRSHGELGSLLFELCHLWLLCAGCFCKLLEGRASGWLSLVPSLGLTCCGHPVT